LLKENRYIFKAWRKQNRNIMDDIFQRCKDDVKTKAYGRYLKENVNVTKQSK